MFQMDHKVLLYTENFATCEAGSGICTDCPMGKYTDRKGRCQAIVFVVLHSLV
jgi:hypothetical protein